MDDATYTGMPAALSMREVRVGGWTLVSSLTDAKAVSKPELLDLYRSRWHVELDFRSIKDAMQMDVLRCKTAQMVRKEVAVHLLAYNLIRTVTAQASSAGSCLAAARELQGSVANTQRLLAQPTPLPATPLASTSCDPIGRHRTIVAAGATQALQQPLGRFSRVASVRRDHGHHATHQPDLS